MKLDVSCKLLSCGSGFYVMFAATSMQSPHSSDVAKRQSGRLYV